MEFGNASSHIEGNSQNFTKKKRGTICHRLFHGIYVGSVKGFLFKAFLPFCVFSPLPSGGTFIAHICKIQFLNVFQNCSVIGVILDIFRDCHRQNMKIWPTALFAYNSRENLYCRYSSLLFPLFSMKNLL